MFKITRKIIAALAVLALLIGTLLALNVAPAAAASVWVELFYTVDGNETTVEVMVKNAPEIAALEIHFDMTGKTYVPNSGKRHVMGAISRCDYVVDEGVVKYLGLKSVDDPDDFFEIDASGNIVFCSFKYTGGGIFSAPTFIGGMLTSGEKITAKTPSTPLPTIQTPPITTTDPPPTEVPPIGHRRNMPLMIGTLVDSNGKPLSGMKVVLLPDAQIAVTDREGKFVFICLNDRANITYTMVLQDKEGKEIARKSFEIIEDGKEFAVGVNSITLAHGCYIFALTVTLDANNNIIFGTPVPCADAPAKKPGKAPYTA